MKNVIIPVKLAIGFSLVILVFVVAGGLSILDLNVVKEKSSEVAVFHIPRVQQATTVERYYLLSLRNVDLYTRTGDERFLASAKKYISKIEELKDVKSMGDSVPSIMGKSASKKGAETAIYGKINEYGDLIDSTSNYVKDIQHSRKVADSSGNSLLNLLVDYLNSENNMLRRDIALSQARNKRTLTERMNKIREITGLISLATAVITQTYRAQALDDIDVVKNVMANFSEIEKSLGRLNLITKDRVNRLKLANSKKAAITYKYAMQGLIESWDKLNNARKKMDENGKSLVLSVENNVNHHFKDIKAISNLTVEKVVETSFVTVTGAIIAAIIAVLIAILLSRTITRPINRAVDFAKKIAGKELTTRLHLNRKDEMGILASALNEMADNLSNITIQIREGAEQVAATSEEIAGNVNQMAEGSQNQASSLEETSASMEQLAASIEQVAEHASSQAASVEQTTASLEQIKSSTNDVMNVLDDVLKISSDAYAKADEGAKQLEDTISAINRIAEESGRIGEIVKLISDIAEQTNLLALNASIEAARAGEHGRGFAVVADEVSKLADGSAEAAKEIAVLIDKIREMIRMGVNLAEKSGRYMKEITEGSYKTKERVENLGVTIENMINGVNEIAKAINSINDMTQSISAATEQQSTSAKEVSRAIETINQVTQEASSSAEELAAATEELSGIAQELQALVANINVGEDISTEGIQIHSDAKGNISTAVQGREIVEINKPGSTESSSESNSEAEIIAGVMQV